MEEWLEQYVGKTPAELITNALPIIITIIVCLIVIKVINRIVKKAIEKSKLRKGLHKFVEKTISIILYFIAILIVADMMNVPVTSLLATFSVVGLAASLAVQDILSNLAGGITVLATHPFKTGDYVDVSDVSGTVKEVTFTYTVLSTPDNKIIRVPNKDVVGATIVNYSESSERRLELVFNVSYNAKTKEVIDVIKGVVDATPKILKNKDIFIRPTAYKDSGVNYTLRVWVKNKDYWDVYFDLFENVKYAFDDAGIEIPYNQLDVHIKKD